VLASRNFGPRNIPTVNSCQKYLPVLEAATALEHQDWVLERQVLEHWKWVLERHGCSMGALQDFWQHFNFSTLIFKLNVHDMF
jgi:hypothetical protein